VSYHFVVPRYLAQGSVPTPGARLSASFDTVVLCAVEHQRVPLPGVEVMYVPLDDSGPPPTALEVQLAWKAAKLVAKRVRAGKRVLVTCAMGRNRSGLVMGFTLIMLGLTAQQAVAAIRRARGADALSNRHFVQLLGQVRAA